jgi:hypothetical protein
MTKIEGDSIHCRSQVVVLEIAVRNFMAQSVGKEAERRGLELINRQAYSLNA